MAKKKKKPLITTPVYFFVPGMTIPVQFVPNVNPQFTTKQKKEIAKEQMTIARAWLEYTGIPAMVGGGLGAFGINAAWQAGQVKSGTSMFSAARFGFGLALLLEAIIGTAILATFFTILDTQDLHPYGLTNEPIGKTVYDDSLTKKITEFESVPSYWKGIWLSGQ